MKTANKYEQNVSINKILMITGLSAILTLTGCQPEGSSEKVGQKLDRSIESAERKIEQVTEQAGKEFNEARKSITDKAEASGQYLSDSVITTNVKTAILNDPLLKASEITITTVDGIVQLSGTLNTQESIDRALEVAKKQENVKSVQNDLMLSAPVLAE